METKLSEDKANIRHTIFDWAGFGAVYIIALGMSTWVMSNLFEMLIADNSRWQGPVSTVSALLVVTGIAHFEQTVSDARDTA